MSRPLSRRHSRTASQRVSVQDVAVLFATSSPCNTPSSFCVSDPATTPTRASKRRSRHSRHASLAGQVDLLALPAPGMYSSLDQRKSAHLSPRGSVASASVLFAGWDPKTASSDFSFAPAGFEPGSSPPTNDGRLTALEKLEGKMQTQSTLDKLEGKIASFSLPSRSTSLHSTTTVRPDPWTPRIPPPPPITVDSSLVESVAPPTATPPQPLQQSQYLDTLFEEEDESHQDEGQSWALSTPVLSYSRSMSRANSVTGARSERDEARKQVEDLRAQLDRAEQLHAQEQVAWQAAQRDLETQRAQDQGTIQDLEQRMVQLQSTLQTNQMARSQLVEQLEMTQNERDTYLDDIAGWRQRCADLEAQMHTETERADTQAQLRATLAAKAVKMANRCACQEGLSPLPDTLTPDELAPAMVSAPRLHEQRIASNASSSEASTISDTSSSSASSVPVVPSPEATVQLLGAMRQQIISLAGALAHEREHPQYPSTSSSSQRSRQSQEPQPSQADRSRSTNAGSSVSTWASESLGSSGSTAPTSHNGSMSSWSMSSDDLCPTKSDDTVIQTTIHELPEDCSIIEVPPTPKTPTPSTPVPVPQSDYLDFNPHWSFASARMHPVPASKNVFPLPDSDGPDFFQLGTELTLPALTNKVQDLPLLTPQPVAQPAQQLAHEPGLLSRTLQGLGGYFFSSTTSSSSSSSSSPTAPKPRADRVYGAHYDHGDVLATRQVIDEMILV